MWKLLYDLGIILPIPIRLYCDNISATYMSANPIHHDHNKHIPVDYHSVRERVAGADLIVCYIPPSLQIADIFTKGLSSKQFLFLKSNLSGDPPVQIEGA